MLVLRDLRRGQACEQILQIIEWIEAVPPTTAQQGVDHRGGLIEAIHDADSARPASRQDGLAISQSTHPCIPSEKGNPPSRDRYTESRRVRARGLQLQEYAGVSVNDKFARHGVAGWV